MNLQTSQITNSKKGDMPIKNARITKRAVMPVNGTIILKGNTASNKFKTFHFSIVSPAQQMKERNKAYRFFQP